MPRCIRILSFNQDSRSANASQHALHAEFRNRFLLESIGLFESTGQEEYAHLGLQKAFLRSMAFIPGRPAECRDRRPFPPRRDGRLAAAAAARPCLLCGRRVSKTDTFIRVADCEPAPLRSQGLEECPAGSLPTCRKIGVLLLQRTTSALFNLGRKYHEMECP